MAIPYTQRHPEVVPASATGSPLGNGAGSVVRTWDTPWDLRTVQPLTIRNFPDWNAGGDPSYRDFGRRQYFQHTADLSGLAPGGYQWVLRVRNPLETVNGKKVNIPSYLLSVGDVIELKESSRSLDKIKGSLEANASRVIPKWLDFDQTNRVAKVVAVAAREDIDLPIEEHLIVELYSK